MGLYNILRVEVACPACHTTAERHLQLKYGHCRLDDVRLGDRVTWATGRARIANVGSRASGWAWLPTYAQDACPTCGEDSEWAAFAVVVDGDLLVRVVAAAVGHAFAEDRDVVPLAAGTDPVPQAIR